MFLSETCEQEDISADIAVIVGITSTEVVKRVQSRLVGTVPTLISFDSDPGVETWLGGLKFAPVDWIEKTLSALPGSKRAEAAKVMSIVTDAWERRNSDDYRFALLVLIDSYVTPVKLLKSLRATGLASVGCMIRNCRSQILACLLDPNCRQAINCLQSCGPTDQVCSYRCIVSNESPAFEAFTLCVLQKHNCLGLSAEITMQPDVQPLSVFRGAAIDHDVAEDLFIGWLGRPNLGLGMQKLDWSWRVVAGQNAAYDQFPSQYQMFYRGKAKGSMWYDPVFQVGVTKTSNNPNASNPTASNDFRWWCFCLLLVTLICQSSPCDVWCAKQLCGSSGKNSWWTHGLEKTTLSGEARQNTRHILLHCIG